MNNHWNPRGDLKFANIVFLLTNETFTTFNHCNNKSYLQLSKNQEIKPTILKS